MEKNNLKLDLKRIETMYNNMVDIWPEYDKWYKYTHQVLQKYICKYCSLNTFSNHSMILNVGSGGNTYNIPGVHYHVDIAYEHIKKFEHAYHCSAENLPFEDGKFDGGICVGSVIDYCDPFLVIHEISRTLKNSAMFVLDFEQSKSWQFYGTKNYNAPASIITSFNNFQDDNIWIYSLSHIKNIFNINNLKIIDIKYFHNLSPLVYRMIHDEQKAAKFAALDTICSKIPILKSMSCNIILTIQKV